jgi:plastocyanin
VHINIQNHLFEPAEIKVAAGVVLKIIIHNLDNTVEEFESFDLKREKIVPAQGKVAVSVGPLKPGTYKFFGEFHQETAQGIILVK